MLLTDTVIYVSTPGPHRRREQRVRVTEPLAFHFSAHSNRLEQAPEAPRLEILSNINFFHVTRTALRKNRPENDRPAPLNLYTSSS